MEDNAYMKTVKPQTVKKAAVKKAVTKPKVKLSKQDPNYYAKIGAISAAKRKLSKDYFSQMAKLSHGENSARDGYHGGRKKKDATEAQ
jgi:hypothetical protein